MKKYTLLGLLLASSFVYCTQKEVNDGQEESKREQLSMLVRKKIRLNRFSIKPLDTLTQQEIEALEELYCLE